jgi:hypothetical protein
MLHSFLMDNRAALIEQCRAAAAARVQPDRDDLETHGIPLFLDQLIETLMIEQTAESPRSRLLSGIPGGGSSSEIADTATLHGRDLLKSGFTLGGSRLWRFVPGRDQFGLRDSCPDRKKCSPRQSGIYCRTRLSSPSATPK